MGSGRGEQLPAHTWLFGDMDVNCTVPRMKTVVRSNGVKRLAPWMGAIGRQVG